jgi:ribose/xylose/arabinose/galactoside ABC-type transport system permease subunit
MSVVEGVVSGPRAMRMRARLRRANLRVLALILFDIAFVVVIASINQDFISGRNVRVIIDNMGSDTIVLTGTVLLLAAGRFDLSIDGVAGLSGVVAGKAMVNAGFSGVEGLIVGIAVGAAVGLVNGALIEYGGLNPLMTTLGTWWATSGIALGVTQGFSPYGFPTSFTRFGQTYLLGDLISAWYALVLVIVVGIILAYTKFGSHIYATGGDRESSRLNGVRVRRVGLILYVYSGSVAGFAGTIFAARLDNASAQPVNGLALLVIAGAVIGGASLSGGRGSMIGGVFGLLLLEMLSNAGVFVGVPAFWSQMVTGLVLLVAVAADALGQRRAQRG